jgi:hypothetical protein
MEKLPEKWCIKWGNKKNFEIIQGFLGKISNSGLYYTREDIHSISYVDHNNNYHGTVKPEFPEITFEQFCNWVLNTPIICEPLIFN